MNHEPDHEIVSPTLIKAGNTITRLADRPQPLQHVDLLGPEINVAVSSDKSWLSSPLPVKGLELQFDDDEARFEDNRLDEQVVHAHGLNGRNVTIMNLGIAADWVSLL